MALGVILYILIHIGVSCISVLPWHLSGYTRLLIIFGLFSLYWIIYVFTVPKLKAHIYHVFVDKLHNLFH